MSFLTITDRMYAEKVRLEGIEICLKWKFGDEGLKLMPELRELRDHVLLGKILKAVEPAASPDALRRLWTRKRRSKRRPARDRRAARRGSEGCRT